MKVALVASTSLNWSVADSLADTKFGQALIDDLSISSSEGLIEFAGRTCYKSYDRPNPATADNDSYIKHLIAQGHESVFEHASASFRVEGVSRSLLLELERHRFLSFSVESQRYVDQVKSHPDPVIPPAFRGTLLEGDLRDAYEDAMNDYMLAVGWLMSTGHSVKQAREAARAFLPNCTPVDFVVTGNLRCWRDVLKRRFHVAADAEIREFAGSVLHILRAEVAPAVFSDFPAKPFGSDE